MLCIYAKLSSLRLPSIHTCCVDIHQTSRWQFPVSAWKQADSKWQFVPDIFDPADFLGNARQKADVKRWRESEITHGRVAMLAALGFIVQEQIIDFPNLPFPHVEGARAVIG